MVRVLSGCGLVTLGSKNLFPKCTGFIGLIQRLMQVFLHYINFLAFPIIDL